MSQVRFRQLARLEKRALSYIKRKQRYQEEQRVRSAPHRECDFVKIADLAVLILYGDPKIGEPLTSAWQRCLESKACKECREKHPDIDRKGPFNERSARSIAEYFCECILPGLPGADGTEKLNAIFAKAPAWLLWFAGAELSILCFGLKLPDLSSMSRFARPRGREDYLPYGAFELRRLPDGEEDRILPLILEVERKQLAIEAKLTPRERMRALRLKESDALSVIPSGSRDDRPDRDAVAAWLRRMSQASGFVDASATEHRGRRYGRQ